MFKSNLVHNGPHKYRRINIAKKPKYHYVYQCMLPGCNHNINSALIIGKLSYCWKCDKEMVIEKKRSKPVCRNCWDELYGKREVLDIVDDILKEKIL